MSDATERRVVFNSEHRTTSKEHEEQAGECRVGQGDFPPMRHPGPVQTVSVRNGPAAGFVYPWWMDEVLAGPFGTENIIEHLYRFDDVIVWTTNQEDGS